MLTDQDKKEILLGNGLNPEEFDLSEDGYRATKKVIAQPAITNTPVAPSTTKYDLSPTGDTPFTTFKKSAGASIIPTLLAGAGAGLATSQLNPLAHVLPPYSEIALGLAGMGLGAWGGNKLQENLDILPPDLEQSQSDNPMSALAGGLVTMPLGGFSAGPQAFKNIGRAAGAVPKLVSGMARTPAETQALVNVGLGTGLGAALPAGEAIAHGETPDLKSILTSALTGMAFNEPNIIGKRLFGFHPTVNTDTGLPGLEDVAKAPLPVTLNPRPEGAPIKPEDVSLLNRLTGATWKEGSKGKVDLVPAGTGTLSEVGAAETSARNMQEAFDKGLPVTENPTTRTYEIKAAEAEKSRQDWEEARIQNEALKRAQIDNETARLKAENERMANELRAGLTPKLEAAPLPPPKATTELGNEIRPDYTGVIEDANTQVKNESQADLEARRAEGFKDRYSEKSALEEAPIGTEFTGNVVRKIKEAGISPERTPSWKTKWGQFLRYKRGIKVVNGEVINEVTGQRVAGKTIKNKVGEIVNEIDNVKGKLDTDAHEGIHGFIDSIRDTPLYKRFEQLVSSSPEFQAINEARTKSGAERWTPEEYIATEQGYEFLDRNLKLKGETEFNTWWKDFSSHIKTKFGKGGKASPEDYRRILQYKFQYDKPTKGSPGSVPVVNNQTTSQLEKPTDKDWQVTVQPEEPGIPGTGYVQIDDITGGVNHWSKGPESLTKEGYVVPDFKKLPMGKYKYEDAVKKLEGVKYSEGSELADEPSMYLTAPRIIEKLNIKQAGGGQWYGTLANKVNPFEMSMLKEAGIEDFLAPQTVHTGKEVADWIRANGPKVEVHSYGMERKVSEAKREYDRMTHEWYDTLTAEQQHQVTKYATAMWPEQSQKSMTTIRSKYGDEMAKKTLEYAKVKLASDKDTIASNNPRATSAYNSVSAFNTHEPMPEWTTSKEGKNVQRVDVVIPQMSDAQALAKYKQDLVEGKRGVFTEAEKQARLNAKTVDEISELGSEVDYPRTSWSPDNLHENLPNTLGWAMIQYKTGPKGEKIAVIAEAQSRWGQTKRANEPIDVKKDPQGGETEYLIYARDKDRKPYEISASSPEKAMEYAQDEWHRDYTDHPLLKDYNRLILKAAIEQARKEGATHIMVSDAETAMITEGHDAHTVKKGPIDGEGSSDKQYAEQRAKELTERTGTIHDVYDEDPVGGGLWRVNSTGKPSQEPGMRLNYDTVLPKIAEELTGSKGERVSLGEHKNAFIQGNNGIPTERRPNIGKPRENLIFRNADGTPKTDVSGRIYDISKTPEKFSLTAKRYSEQSELADPNVDKVTKLGEKAFDDSIEAASYDNELGAQSAGDLANKFYNLRGILSGSKLDVRNSEKSELGDTHYKASFAPFLTARFDKIAENLKSPTAKMVTDNLNNFAAEQDILTGRIGNELIAAGKDFNTEEQQRVYRYAHQMSVNGDSNMTLTGREKKLFAARLSIIQDVRKLQNELGLKVRAGEEFRAGGIDPKGYIFSEIDPAVANTWAEKPNSAQSKSYDAAYIKHMTDHGISLKDATQALHEYKGAIGSNKPIDVEFGALRKAAGVGLPWELIDKNFNSAAIRYARRASRDLAYFKWIQNNPKMLKALDLRDQYGKLPTVEDVKDIENIAPNAAVKQAIRSVEGVSDNNINPTTMAYARAANNTIMGIGTAARNILNMPAFIASYVQTSQLPKVAQAISHMSESRVRAFKNNAVRASFEDFDAAGYYLGNPNPTIRLLNRYSELSRKYQGRNLSDKFEGEYYYSLGELLATDNIAKAKEGNKESKGWVKKFGSTVDKGADSLLTRKVTNDDIERMAKAFVDAARGTYGPSGLPSFAIEGQLSPFFALSRFSIEKANTIWKDVVEPARKGIYGPAIRYILGSAGVGYAIEALNELLSNKRGGEPTVSEVMESGTMEDKVAKAISTAQLASFAGIISDGAQLVSNAARGKGLSYSNPVSFPLYTLITDTFGRNITDAANAIKEGEDTFEVLGKLATVLSTQSVQTMRYLDAHVLHPEEAKRKEKFRDYNVWMQLTDRATPEQSGKANEFKNLSSKEFKRESDLPKAVAMIPDLVSKAVRKSKDRNNNIDPVMLSENLKSLKLNSYQIMPALENDPKAFADYYQHVSDTQGSNKAKKLLINFMSQREVNKVKNSMVPSF